MAVWSVGIESGKGQQGDQIWRTQQLGGFEGLGRAPAHLASRKQPMANNEAARCRNLARGRGGLAADERQCDLEPRIWWDSGQKNKSCMESQEVLWLNNGCKAASVDVPLVAVDVHMGAKFKWSMVGDRGAAGYERGVTGEAVSELCQLGQLTEAVEALGGLVRTDCHIDRSLFYKVLRGCMRKKDLALGRRVHALSVKKGCESDTFLCNHILRMYASHAKLQEAMDLFSVVPEPDAFMWSSIISAHVKHGQDKQAIQLYHLMRRSSVEPDGHVFVAALQACARGADLKSGQQVHADLLATGVERDAFVCSCLVDMYAKCGSLEDAQRVFDLLPQKNVVTWSAMIAGYSKQGMGQEALDLYRAMQEEGIVAPNSVTFVCLLQACASVGTPSLERGKQLHADIKERGFHADVVVGGSLVNMYAKCGNLEGAREVFDELEQKNVVTWNAMIAGYTQQSMGLEALHLYRDMQEASSVTPNSVTFVCLLQACASLGNPALEEGMQLHAEIRERGLQGEVVVGGSLVNMYAKCGSLDDARGVFDGLSQKDVVTWSAMIAGYSQQGMGQEALRLYASMQEEGFVAPNAVTFVCLLQACASVGTPAFEKGKQLHGQITEQGLQADVFVASSLISMYVKCDSPEAARGVFNGLPQRDAMTWGAMIAGYSQQGMGQEALHLYRSMQQEGIAAPDSVTIVSLLQACASVGTQALDMGKQLHAQIRKQKLEVDVFVANSLVHMYAECGSLEDAQVVFDKLGEKNVVTWSAMIAGYSKQGMGHDALRLYKAMQEEGIVAPNAVTFVCLLQACASVAALQLGSQLHVQIKQQGLQPDILVAGSLINMYAKCGSMVDAHQVFGTMPKRDIVPWNALIGGYSRQGDSEQVFDLFLKMREDGIQPDGITFIAVLTVCSHTGLVDKGHEYFEAMSRHYGITPTTDHLTCMVGLLGRAGQLDKALAVVKSMTVPPDAAVWHTLLGACLKWSNVELGRHAFHEAVKLDKKNATAYMLMSNIYSSAEMWVQAEELQARRITVRAWKQPGQSWWTDMDGLVHSFLVGYKKPQRSELGRI